VFSPEGPSLRELAVQALSSVEHGYDLLAPKFEFTPFRTPDALIDPVAAHIGPIDAALDVCCGTGAGMRMLRPLCRSHVTGIDVSRGMMAEAERLLADAPGTAALRFVRGDVLDMPFDGEFDVATCFGALGHILESDHDRFAKSVHKALKPGGRFLFVTGDMPTPMNPRWWMGRGFNFAMHVRNAIFDPPFVMFYLLLMVPQAREVLERNGFDVEVVSGAFPKFPTAKLVIGTRRA
jgi:SAM-dependent methyltransferase